MTFRGFLSRAEIGLRPPRSVSYSIDPSQGGTAGHYAGAGQSIVSHEDCLSRWRAYQRTHMDPDGLNWVDIAYTGGVCDHGYAFAGRGAGVRTAANGTNDANSRFYAVQWIGGGDDSPTLDAVDAFWWFVTRLREEGGAGPAVRKHSDFRFTACPGRLGAVIDAGPVSNPPTPEAQDDEMLVQHGSSKTVYHVVGGNLVPIASQVVARLIGGKDWQDKVVTLTGAQFKEFNVTDVDLSRAPDRDGGQSHEVPSHRHEGGDVVRD